MSIISIIAYALIALAIGFVLYIFGHLHGHIRGYVEGSEMAKSIFLGGWEKSNARWAKALEENNHRWTQLFEHKTSSSTSKKEKPS